MADTEFEEFKQYFDQLPQYIRAPPLCYTLVHDIDIEDDEGSVCSKDKGNVGESNETLTLSSFLSEDDSGMGESMIDLGHDRILEPFCGDLQLAIPDQSPLVVRKRRKLPEIPKHAQQQRQLFLDSAVDEGQDQGCRYLHRLHNANGSGHQQSRRPVMSLAQELSEAEKRNNNTKQCFSGSSGSTSGSTPMYLNETNHSSPQFLMDAVTEAGTGNHPEPADDIFQRPIFVLKFNDSRNNGRGPNSRKGNSRNNAGGKDDEISSPDSEHYTSLDSGNSTVHSDDGFKSYSPQVSSINNESFSPGSPSMSGIPFTQTQLEILEATHRGLHKFVPRHHDEIEVDIGDPIYMQKEADDLWCEGVNLRTGMQGIFPSAYVVDVDYNDFDPAAAKVKKERYLLNYIGSIETLYHKGNQVLCQAVRKITEDHKGYVTSHTRPCILEISDYGIHMLDKGKGPKAPNTPPSASAQDYFYALKNVSFCGFHPSDHRYFGFVTKHPALNRFACHVFISDDSTRPVAEAVGRAFQRFYQKFLETAYPIEDIYLE